MHYIRLVNFCLLLFFSFQIYGENSLSLRSLNNERIEAHKKNITQELTRNYYQKKAISIGLLCFIVGGAYKLLSSVPAEPEQTVALSLPLYQVFAKFARHIQNCDTMTAVLNDYGYGAAPLTWSQWIKSYGRWIGNQALSIGLSLTMSASLNPFLKHFQKFDQAVDRVVGKVYHENTLSWFITHRSSINLLLSDLINQAKKIDSKENKEELDVAIFRTTWALCIEQCEAILGFMNYKRDSIARNSLLNAERVDQCIQQLAGSLEKYRIALESKLPVGLLLEDVTVLKSSIDETLVHFTQLETVLLYSTMP